MKEHRVAAVPLKSPPAKCNSLLPRYPPQPGSRERTASYHCSTLSLQVNAARMSSPLCSSPSPVPKSHSLFFFVCFYCIYWRRTPAGLPRQHACALLFKRPRRVKERPVRTRDQPTPSPQRSPRMSSVLRRTLSAAASNIPRKRGKVVARKEAETIAKVRLRHRGGRGQSKLWFFFLFPLPFLWKDP